MKTAASKRPAAGPDVVRPAHETRDAAGGPETAARQRSEMDAIVSLVRTHHRNADADLLEKAFRFAGEAHRNQLRKSGVPYIEHCLDTARTLAELRMDAVTVAAGLLHDVAEDTGVSIDEVREAFGDPVAQLVDGVTKISELKFNSREEEQAENFRKMIFSMSKDLRVILIKFADRLNNMRTLEFLPAKKAERIAMETREIYAPLAHRFGMARIKWELEDLALKALDRPSYDQLSRKLQDRSDESGRFIRRTIDPIQRELQNEGIQSEIAGRSKSLYSIYRKMKERFKPFEEIYDLLAIRILVDDIDQCYFALGVVHKLYTPVHDRFKDYIATPKINMYQSLHTTVIGPAGKMVEIQIRTREMHRVAEIGIAAHWKYKEGRKKDDELDRYSAWLREMIDWQKDTLDPKEYMDILKTDLFRTEIFVFTPKGDLLKLPQGSTPIDFAFAVHTDIGVHCIGAKVNNRIVSLNTALQNGDSVEIITSAHQRPHQDWLTFVRTSKAKSRIKQWLKEAQHHEAIRLGEEILANGMKRYKIKAGAKELRQAAQTLGKRSVEELYAELGRGEIPAQKILEILVPDHPLTEPESPQSGTLFEKFLTRARGSARGIRVQGMDHFLIRFAKCCHPVPGDAIVGFITKGRGIVVHRRDCLNSARLGESPERIIEVSWDVDSQGAFLVQLRLIASERKDFLKDTAESLVAMNTHIVKMDMRSENTLIDASLILEVKDLTHLTQIIRRLQGIKGVISVNRDSGTPDASLLAS
ncbi:bifunctional (p)ppGpp synthetase/guanosine-3',5'-bis(diphosphate) 3'-pyrophosphohydrolase [bacterium]|nr:bifunctional (p)ppGpp synthetase/guanosine-3',5'-bis(diphosphate) 3'-pyrophosphohydrolase [bacterium]